MHAIDGMGLEVHSWFPWHRGENGCRLFFINTLFLLFYIVLFYARRVGIRDALRPPCKRCPIADREREMVKWNVFGLIGEGERSAAAPMPSNCVEFWQVLQRVNTACRPRGLRFGFNANARAKRLLACCLAVECSTFRGFLVRFFFVFFGLFVSWRIFWYFC